MTKEYLHELVQMEGVLRFFKENYPVDGEDVKKVIEEANKHETIHLKAASYLVSKIGGVAERVGIVHDSEFPINHLPTMLAAVKELEMDVSTDKKRLTNKHTLELLARAELVTAESFCKSSEDYKGVREHALRAIKLLDFTDTLNF